MAKYLKKHLIMSILYLVLLIGLCLLLYPSVSKWWNLRHQSRMIASYVKAVENMSGGTIETMLEDAWGYNERLSVKDMNLFLTREENEEYESLLDVSGTGIMGYVEIPRIGVRQSVYHGTDDTVLQIAVGHIPGTSLPVGGESTHSVLSGHHGLPGARLFTDLDQMQEGDIFTITVMNQVISYKVDQIRIVEPDDISDLQIIPGGDYCTLVTCTPYGINTHRLLVRGVRIENMIEDLDAEAVRIPPYIAVVVTGIPILFVALVILLVCYRHRKPTKTEQELLEELRKMLDG